MNCSCVCGALISGIGAVIGQYNNDGHVVIVENIIIADIVEIVVVIVVIVVINDMAIITLGTH